MCQVCTSVPPGEPQVLIGNDNKAFTFDFVFDMLARQDAVYDACCKQLVEGYGVLKLECSVNLTGLCKFLLWQWQVTGTALSVVFI